MVTRIDKPWGFEELRFSGPKYKVKLLCLLPKSRTSLQKHSGRNEFFLGLEGEGFLEKEKEMVFGKDIHRYRIIPDSPIGLYCNKGDVHRISNPYSAPLVILEIQTGDYLDDLDIERLEDDYGRS